MGRKKPGIKPFLVDFKNAIQKKYGIEKVFLFGSQASGNADDDSDFDFLVVSNRKDKLALMKQLYYEWHMVLNIDYPVDFLTFTPEEFEKKRKQITIVREAVENGIAI